MSISKFRIAKPKITKFLDRYPESVFKRSELATILREHRGTWGLAKKTTINEFINDLLDDTSFKQIDFPFLSRKETRYVWRDVALLTIANDTRHHTAPRALVRPAPLPYKGTASMVSMPNESTPHHCHAFDKKVLATFD